MMGSVKESTGKFLQNETRATGHETLFTEAPAPYFKLSDINLNFALHRLFTFFAFIPLDFWQGFPFARLLELAELGLNCVNERGRAFFYCTFCTSKFSPEEVQGYSVQYIREKMNCRAHAQNMPLGDVEAMQNYNYEAYRLFSLLKKPDWQHVEPFGLARNGFYYTGDQDRVRCAFCKVEVCKWTKGDTPESEHKSWSPDCPFLRNAADVGNIVIGKETIKFSHDGLGTPSKGSRPFTPPATETEHDDAEARDAEQQARRHQTLPQVPDIPGKLGELC
ncbi:putative inhibitor of apoptosis [Cloeon dipterum]|uniref:putative inhibitor of apoptosis n=1 Tax=Cloeon dipterum TaxID=197152 RepID=UPI00321F9B33